MSAHASAMLGKLTVAFRLFGELRLLVRPGGVLANEALSTFVTALEVGTGEAYRAALQAAGPDCQFSEAFHGHSAEARKLGEIFSLALQMDLPAVKALAEDPDFVYRDQARVILELRGFLDGKGARRRGGAEAASAKAAAKGRLVDEVMKAVVDPGMYVARGGDDESVTAWQRSAINTVFDARMEELCDGWDSSPRPEAASAAPGVERGGESSAGAAGYLPVPVAAARGISREFAKDIVVIVCFDHRFGQVHTTTFGISPEDKLRAADLGTDLAAVAGADVSQPHYTEDFRTAANQKAEIDRLRELLESSIMDLEKLGPMTGGASAAAAQLYRDAIAAPGEGARP